MIANGLCISLIPFTLTQVQIQAPGFDEPRCRANCYSDSLSFADFSTLK